MKNLIILSFLFASVHTEAQTLFSYGDHQVSKQEFLHAYNKNTNGEKPTSKSYHDYLELYTRFKLKVLAAYDKKMDTLPGQIAELQNFRNQIADSYMNDEGSLRKLIDEAFQRSQHDIRLAHIFIPVNGNDTSAAWKKAMEAYRALTKGTDFGKVAMVFSADSSSFGRGGEIGYITVFTLPYALENLAYSTPSGKFSKPYRSKAGYHIFKNIEEQNAIGKMTATHIQLMFPPDATDNVKKEIKKRADSLYAVLQKGADFNKLAEKFSDDNLTYQSGGILPPFGTGVFDPAFEKEVFALSKNGDISKPILTTDGYHIVKRISLTPVNTNRDSVDAISSLTQQIKNDARINVSHEVFIKKAYELTGLKKDAYDETKLSAYYKDHLEEYNPDFAIQIKEFKDGNLLFEIMQSMIWDKAANDSLGLKKYYEDHKASYQWEPSADVIVFTCNDSATAVAARSSFSINTAGWRDLVKGYESKMQADSGRYELSQLPITDPSHIKAGMITQPSENKGENTVSFIYIKKLYGNATPRSYNDAKGFVLNDYQAELEEKWINDLKKKYPVKVDEEVLEGL